MTDIKYCQIYRTTNLVNGRQYIGQSKTDNPFYYGSGKIILRALQKHGRRKFKKDILWSGHTSSKSLNRLEILFISQNKTMIKYGGYNLVKGGLGYNHKIGRKDSDKTRKMKSDARIGMRFSNEHKRNLSKAKIGTIQSKKHLTRRAIAMSGNIISINGLLYGTQRIASECIGVSVRTIGRRLKDDGCKTVFYVLYANQNNIIGMEDLINV